MIFYFEFLAFFLGTLLGYSKGLIILSFFLYLMIFYKKRKTITLSRLVFFIASIALLVFYLSLAVFYPEVYLQIDREKEILVYKFIGYTLLISLIYIVIESYKSDLDRLFIIILYTALTHVLFFYVQIIVYYISGINIDVLYYVTGEHQRNLYLGQFRASGMLVEPSTYAYFMTTLIASMLYIKRINPYILVLLIPSLFLTFSTAAFISGIVLLLGIFVKYYWSKKNLYKIFFVLLLSSPLIYLGADFQLKRFSENSIEDTGAVNIRMKLIESLSQRNFYSLESFFGTGVFSYDINIYNAQDSQERAAAIDDGTVVISTLIRFGFIGVLFFAIFLIKLCSWKDMILFLSIVLTKTIFFNFIFWVPFVVLANLGKRSNND